MQQSGPPRCAYVALMLAGSPLLHKLTAKVLALVAYIVLGMIALKHGRTRAVRAGAFAAALASVAYIVSVALSRDPTPWS